MAHLLDDQETDAIAMEQAFRNSMLGETEYEKKDHEITTITDRGSNSDRESSAVPEPESPLRTKKALLAWLLLCYSVSPT